MTDVVDVEVEPDSIPDCHVSNQPSSSSQPETSQYPSDPKLLDKLIEETDDYFGSIIDWIPIDSYGFDDDARTMLRDAKHEITDNKLTKLERRKFGKQAKHRLAMIDSSQIKTVSQALKFLDTKKKVVANQNKKANRKQLKRKADGSDNKSSTDVDSQAPPIAFSREDLTEKIRAKLDNMKSVRTNPKSDAYMVLERKRVKRRLSKLKLKERRSTVKTEQTLEKLRALPAEGDTVSTPATEPIMNGDATPQQKKRVPLTNGTATPANSNPKKPIFNSEGKQVFSKFDFAVAGHGENDGKDKSRSDLTGRNYKEILKKVKGREKLVGMIKNKDPERAAKYEQKQFWKAALERAEGGKVKDDPELLKKNIKRKQKTKEKAKKKWRDRVKTVESEKGERQTKRQDNLQKRINSKKEKRVDKAKKKGRYVPGF